MANLGFLSNVFAFFDSKDESPISEIEKSEVKKSVWENLTKTLLALFCALLCFYALIKVYEVPVYYTNIDITAENSANYEKMDINIIRNYDRPDKYTSLPESLKYFPILKNNLSGIYVNGKFKSAPYHGLGFVGRRKLDSLQNVCIEARREYTQTSLENPQFVYLSIVTSDRQKIGRKKWPKPDALYHINKDTDTEIETTDKYFNGEREIAEKIVFNDYFNYEKISKYEGGGGCHAESFYYASTADSILSVHTSIETPAFRKPAVWRTLEDVSKLIEIIELGQRADESYGGMLWRITDRLKIDYVGPAEFSEHITPKPDTITLNYILYTDPQKIKEIGRHGLKYHVNFPDMENIQEARVFILSGLVTGLFALFSKYFYRFAKSVIKYFSIKKKWIALALLLIIIIVFCLFWILLQQEVNPHSLSNDVFKN